MDNYSQRALESVLRQAINEFPVIVLTGPRQSGKTRLLQHIFNQSHEYVSLELPDIRASAIGDPRGFLAMHNPPVIFDEIQYAIGAYLRIYTFGELLPERKWISYLTMAKILYL